MTYAIPSPSDIRVRWGLLSDAIDLAIADTWAELRAARHTRDLALDREDWSVSSAWAMRGDLLGAQLTLLLNLRRIANGRKPRSSMTRDRV